MSLSRCCRSGRTAIDAARVAAYGFADHLNRLLNTTVSDSRLALIKVPWGQDVWLINRSEGEREGLPLDLFGVSHKLFFEQQIRVVDDDGSELGKKCQTLSYRYWLQNAAGGILIRWEYDREPPRDGYSYPLAHVHVHALLKEDDHRDLEGVHVATGRVPIEMVLRHLITDWGVAPRDSKWRVTLNESLTGFYERRTRH